MEKLWAPWRIKYVQAAKTRGCIFCQKAKQKRDAKNYIILRGKTVFSMLNIYPYNNGHLMVAPYRHIGQPDKLNEQETAELFSMVNDSVRKLRAKLKPQGFNIGMNIGKAAGAGIDKHLHVHVVPRWEGDTNFMPIISGTRVLAQSLDELYRMLTT